MTPWQLVRVWRSFIVELTPDERMRYLRHLEEHAPDVVRRFRDQWAAQLRALADIIETPSWCLRCRYTGRLLPCGSTPAYRLFRCERCGKQHYQRHDSPYPPTGLPEVAA